MNHDKYIISGNKVGQVRKGIRWMPRHREAKKDAASGETLRGAASEH